MHRGELSSVTSIKKWPRNRSVRIRSITSRARREKVTLRTRPPRVTRGKSNSNTRHDVVDIWYRVGRNSCRGRTVITVSYSVRSHSRRLFVKNALCTSFACSSFETRGRRVLVTFFHISTVPKTTRWRKNGFCRCPTSSKSIKTSKHITVPDFVALIRGLLSARDRRAVNFYGSRKFRGETSALANSNRAAAQNLFFERHERYKIREKIFLPTALLIRASLPVFRFDLVNLVRRRASKMFC